VHQLAGGLDDPAQHDRQREITHDEPVGAQQSPQPALGGQHVLSAVDELGQQVVELQPRPDQRHRRLPGSQRSAT